MSTAGEDKGGQWVDVTDVTARHEVPLRSTQLARVATLIRDGESVLRGRVPRIADRVMPDDLADATPNGLRISELKRVVAQAVIRALAPGGGRVTQYAAGEGGFNESRSYAAPSSGRERTGGVQFTEEELDDLREPARIPDGVGVVHQRISAWRIP